MFRNMDDLATLIRVLVSIGLIYALLILIEVLMTVPFFSWHFAPYIYGYYPGVSIRWGRDQPVVFVNHALELAGLMASTAIAAAALAKAKLPASRFGFRGGAPALLAAVLMTRNVAGNLYAFSVNVAFLILKPTTLIRGAFLLALFAVSYPTLRTFDLLPTDYVVGKAFEFDEERGRSFAGRLGEEEFVLNQEGGRQWLGWGDIARMPGALTFDFYNATPGGLDGWWVIMVASRGFVGMLLTFVLLAIPVFVAWRRSKSIVARSMLPLVAGLMFIIGIRMFDLLLNGWWNNLPLFLSGALLGVMGANNSVASRKKPQHY
jgi:hypothetical protein